MIQNRLISLQCTLNTLNLNIIMIFIIGYCRLLVRFPKFKFGKERQPLYSHQPIILKLTFPISNHILRLSYFHNTKFNLDLKKMTFTLLIVLNNYLKKRKIPLGIVFEHSASLGKRHLTSRHLKLSQLIITQCQSVSGVQTASQLKQYCLSPV